MKIVKNLKKVQVLIIIVAILLLLSITGSIMYPNTGTFHTITFAFIVIVGLRSLFAHYLDQAKDEVINELNSR